MKAFWIHLRKNNLFSDEDFYPLIDGISGPTISNGERRVFQIKVPQNLFNNGYRLRFETAVEDKAYHMNDINIALNTESLKQTHMGQGFIKKIQFIATK